jgi:hypothetical protein
MYEDNKKVICDVYFRIGNRTRSIKIR